MGFVYFTGSADRTLIRIGWTATGDYRRGAASSLAHHPPVLLAAVRTGTQRDHTALLRYFAPVRYAAEREVFTARPELVEYVNWLRQQWFTHTDPADGGPEDRAAFTDWAPDPARRVEPRTPDPAALLQFYDVRPGVLRETAWADLSIPPPAFNDYYTPPALIACARDAMGGIDLDAASNWAANRVHRIPRYYHVGRSAFDNPWAGRVWLNPPYGDNAPWFAEILRYTAAGDLTQLCMLSPVWAFNTAIARPVIDRAAAMVLLTPTPTFWGRDREGREAGPDDPRFGSNHPHAILYLGRRPAEFRAAFARRGVAMRIEAG